MRYSDPFVDFARFLRRKSACQSGLEWCESRFSDKTIEQTFLALRDTNDHDDLDPYHALWVLEQVVKHFRGRAASPKLILDALKKHINKDAGAALALRRFYQKRGETPEL
jgi:hypothetical protein